MGYCRPMEFELELAAYSCVYLGNYVLNLLQVLLTAGWIVELLLHWPHPAQMHAPKILA